MNSRSIKIIEPRVKKLLVANRSEIATRCFRAATELGLRTVAVYSYEDRFSLHRFKADEAFLIGPPEGGEPVRSYLNIDALVAVAKLQNVDAIHPGYGFLSESAAFARACEAASILFIGPTPEQLDTFGDKTHAKRLAQSVGVPTIPGTDTELHPQDDVPATAARIGYPLMIKASFGGGGRGMRVVLKPEDLQQKLEEAQREAAASFGQADVFLERYIRAPNTLKSRCSATPTATSCTSGSATARCSGDIRKSSRWRRASRCRRTPRQICDAAVRLCRAVSTTTPARWSFSSMSTAETSTSSKSTRVSRWSTPSPKW